VRLETEGYPPMAEKNRLKQAKKRRNRVGLLEISLFEI
jgi:hypothetical protein